MTQPPDGRDPNVPDPAPRPIEPPGGEAPTQAWTPENTTFGAPPTPPTPPEPPAPTAPTGPIVSAAPTPGPTVAWNAPAPSPAVGAPGLTWSDTPSRFVAYVADGFLVALMAAIVASIVGVGIAGTRSDTAMFSQSNGVFYAVSALIGAAYYILSWSGGRRGTPGQRMFNIQVGNAFDGRALTTTQAVKRWVGLGGFFGFLAVVPSDTVLGAVYVLEFVWYVVLLITTVTSPTKQGLHDRFANSAVVRPARAGYRAAMACVIIVILLFLLAIVSIVALIFLGGQVSRILSTVGESV
jgi:uncharacterized RDD family membrane protein YckC